MWCKHKWERLLGGIYPRRRCERCDREEEYIIVDCGMDKAWVFVAHNQSHGSWIADAIDECTRRIEI